MNRTMRLSIIWFFILFFANQAAAEVNLIELVKKIQPAVVTVITYDKDKKPSGLGSGFFIDRQGYLITNFHVLEGAYFAEVRTYDNKKFLIKSVAGEDKAVDLIKVLVDIPKKSIFPINVTDKLPDIAEQVVVVGSPKGLEQTVTEGIVSAIREMPNIGKMIQISAPISSGSSGSPVINMKGEVIGVATLYLMGGQNLNFAVPSKRLIELEHAKASKTISEWSSEKIEIADKWFERGESFWKLEKYDDAIEALNKALELNPQHAESMELRGLLWYGKGELERSIADLTKVLKMNPTRFVAMRTYHARGQVWSKKGDFNRAIADYTKELELMPGFHIAHYSRGLAWYDKGLVLHKKGDLKAAIAAYEQSLVDFRKALSKDPTNNRYQTAVNLVENSLKKKPN